MKIKKLLFNKADLITIIKLKIIKLLKICIIYFSPMLSKTYYYNSFFKSFISFKIISVNSTYICSLITFSKSSTKDF